MALRKYNHLKLFRDYVNEVLPIIFPEVSFSFMEIEWRGPSSAPAVLEFNSGEFSGIKTKIYNYVITVNFPEGFRESYPYFDQHFDFKIEELNIWIKSEGKHIRVYPWDRNNYGDTEIEHKKRAVYFASCLYTVLKWVQREMDNEPEDQSI
ncbi:MAG: hypothetical protein ABJ092_14270 [Gillisia sp.]